MSDDLERRVRVQLDHVIQMVPRTVPESHLSNWLAPHIARALEAALEMMYQDDDFAAAKETFLAELKSPMSDYAEPRREP